MITFCLHSSVVELGLNVNVHNNNNNKKSETVIDKTPKSLIKVTFVIHDHVGGKKTWHCTKDETVATAPLVVTGAIWRILETSKHSAEQHATLTANQQYQLLHNCA